MLSGRACLLRMESLYRPGFMLSPRCHWRRSNFTIHVVDFGFVAATTPEFVKGLVTRLGNSNVVESDSDCLPPVGGQHSVVTVDVAALR